MNTQRLVSLVSLSVLVSAPLLAQQASEPEETVVVTGSRIAHTSDFGNSSPVDIIDRADIEKAGYANLQQLMEKIPSNGNGAFSTRGNNQDSTANGAASISIRKGAQMGTCPKCKRKIRKNGNHIKLGSTWYHKACPRRSTARAKA